MPIDDPGWGDYTPPPAEAPPTQQQQPVQPPTQPQPQAQPAAQPQPQPAGPAGPSPFADPKVRMVLAAIVVAALAAGAFFLFAGGDDEKEPESRPAAAAGNDEEDTGEDPPADETGIGTLPIEDYIALADQVCSAYQQDIAAAQQAQDLQALAQVDQAMLDELQKLPPPGEQADLVESIYSDFQQAIDALAANDFQTAQQYASAAQTNAVQLGFGACAQ